MNNIPEQPKNSFRVTIDKPYRMPRLDVVLLDELRLQNENSELKSISRNTFKEYFAQKRILIKGQSAKPSSALAKGVTYIDIMLS